MKTQTKILAGVLAGAAVVAAVGVLMNSDKGTEIKDEIADYFADLIASIKNKAQETANNVLGMKDDAVNTARTAAKRKIDVVADAAISGN